MTRAERITRAMIVVADFLDTDPEAAQIFLRLDAELDAERGGPETRLAAIRARVKRAA